MQNIPDDCKACGRWECAKNPFLETVGREPHDILYVSESPERLDDEIGAPAQGDASQYLKRLERKIGLHKYSITRGYAVRCTGEKPTTKQIKYCKQFIRNDIVALQPKLVITLGAIPLRSVLNLSNITRRHGEIIQQDGIMYLPTFSPAGLLADPRRERDFLRDLEVAKSYLDGIYGKTDKLTRLKKRYTVVSSEAQLADVLADLEKADILAFDTEFEPLEWLGTNLVCLGVIFSTKKRTGVFIPIDHQESVFLGRRDVKDKIAHLLRTKKLIVHDARPDLIVAERCFGVPIHEIDVAFDTMTGSMAIHGPDTTHALKALAYTDADTGGYQDELEEFKKTHDITNYGEIPLHILASPYGAGDGDTTIQIAHKYSKRIVNTGQKFFYNNILKPSYLLNIEMRKHGLLIDWDEWIWREKFFREEKEQIYSRVLEIPEVAAHADSLRAQKKKFSLRSYPQMAGLLFLIFGVEPSGILTNGKKDSLDAKSIKMMILQDIQPNARRLLMSMLASTQISYYYSMFIKGFSEKIWEDGRLHPDFHNFTESARRGSSRPNSQNCPDGSRIPKEIFNGPIEKSPFNIRMLIKARPGYQFISPDYEQLEFRLAACYSHDANMLKGCNPKPNDAHTLVAKKLNISRSPCAKIINFAVIYGAGWSRIQNEMFDKAGLIWDERECKAVAAAMRQEYVDLFETIEEYQSFAALNGYVTTPTGHIRWLPHAKKSNDPKIQQRALREGWNHVVQSLGHDLLELSMNAILRHIRKQNLPWYFVNDLHDGFLLEVPEGDVHSAAKLCKNIMETTPQDVLKDWLLVPLPVEIKTGIHFGNLKEIQI